MKKIFKLLLLTLFLTSCSKPKEEDPKTDPDPIVDPIDDPVVPPVVVCKHENKTKKLEGDKITYTCLDCNETFKEDRYKSLEVYGFNDFHGAIKTNSTLEKFGSYIKEVSAKENTLVIDSGDTWQGSLESNYNRGKCINEVEDYCGVDVRTIGNHDFDWGLEYLQYNTSYCKNMKTLAANLYDFDFDAKENGNIHQKNIGDKYATFTLENNLKIGVIGCIGYEQIVDIFSLTTKTICFKNHNEIFKSLSDELRTKEKCDIIICSVHGGQGSVLGKGLTDISPVSNKKYADLVLCAHSHKLENETENGTLFIQAGSYGRALSDINLKYDCYYDSIETTYSYIETNEIRANSNVDSKITNIINKYDEETNSLGSILLISNVQGSFTSTEGMANLIAEAIYNEAIKEGYNVDYAYTNARSSISTKNWSFSSLYMACPFDNLIYIMKVKGTDMINEVSKYNNICRGNSTLAKQAIDKNKIYTIAVIDFLIFHTGMDRNYDYFTDGFEQVGVLKNSNGEYYNYREITKDYLLNYNGQLNSSNYKNDVLRFDRSKMNQNI